MGKALEESYDYVVIGAGSAGCALAVRLSEDGRNSVLLIEAGGSDKSIFIRMPSALSYAMNMQRFNWSFQSEAEPGAANRRFPCPRGKVLGGSSSINGMVYVRGHACDFDAWERAGASGWGYRHCLPYFRRSESWAGGADDYRGSEGPLATCGGNGMALNPLYEAFIRAGMEAGYPYTSDYNGHQQEGFGAMHMTVRDGVRCSASLAYLDPAKKCAGLAVLTGALTRKILLEGKRAVAVEYQRGSRVGIARCRKEIISCAGSIGSPTLLQRSGIGPAAVLREAGVDVLHDLPGVGENLQDHLEVFFQFKCKQPISLNSKLGWLSKARIGARWLRSRDGLGATNHFESCAFIRSAAGVQWPDIQYHFLPAAMSYDGRSAFRGHGFQVHVGPNKPHSRGRVKIRSADPAAQPSILFNYLQDSRDMEPWRACIRLTREIIGQPAMDAYRGEEIQPGVAVQSDEDIDAWVRQSVESAYHPAGTCRMGSVDDPQTVIDPQCRVVGLEGLRVVDSSIFPSLTNGNINAPTIMAAEKAADLVLGRQPLPESPLKPWLDPQWQSRQRPGPALRPQ